MNTSGWKISAVMAGLALLVLPGTTVVTAEPDMLATAKTYQIVPCLLPARVRRLGNMTYPERRKLVESSARECELRGGEYTYYDRSQPDSAAAFFTKLAEGGDLDAQLSLGDVYQYLYTPPRYQDAAAWYQKAATAGNATAKMQLARLAERGLGVPQDGLLAVNLWREATGAGEELVLASELEAYKTSADQRIAQLTTQLQKRSEETTAARTALAQAQQDLVTRRSAMAVAERDLAALRNKISTLSAGDPAELAKLRTQLVEQQKTIDDQRYQIDSLDGELGVQEAQLAANLKQVEAQNRRLTEELAQVNSEADAQVSAAMATLATKDQEVKRLSSELAAVRKSVGENDGTFAALSKELADVRAAAARDADARRRLVALEQKHAQLSTALSTRQTDVGKMEQALASAAAEANTLRAKLDNQVNATVLAEARFAKSEAELASTRQLLSVRDARLKEATAALSALNKERAVLKTSVAAAKPAQATELQQKLAAQDTRIHEQEASIAALQRDMDEYRGQIAEINLRRQAYASRSAMADTSKIKLPDGAKIGRYHALVIGNDQYSNLTPLQNAGSDAKALHEVLQRDYGFRSKLLLNATRLQMFQGIAELKDLTGPDDLVIIYYAGHGYSTQEQSYWLPVDVGSRAEAPGTGLGSEDVANWIKTIPARHVMVIADSCYSGSGIESTGGTTYSAKDLQMMLPYLIRSRSRTMLTSGGDGPVLDGGGGTEHSVFTRELLGVLGENKGIIHGEQLFSYLKERVKYTVDGDEINQTPTFGSIERAGHESGQFVFLRGGV